MAGFRFAKERDYIEHWFTDLSYGPELIKLAYDRTVDNTGKVSFPYLNRSLRLLDRLLAALEEDGAGCFNGFAGVHIIPPFLDSPRRTMAHILQRCRDYADHFGPGSGRGEPAAPASSWASSRSCRWCSRSGGTRA